MPVLRGRCGVYNVTKCRKRMSIMSDAMFMVLILAFLAIGFYRVATSEYREIAKKTGKRTKWTESSIDKGAYSYSRLENLSYRTMDAVDNASVESVRECMNRIDDLYEAAEINGESEEKLSEIAEVKKEIHDSVQDALAKLWEEKAGNLAYEIGDSYQCCLNVGNFGFKNLEDAKKERDRCLRLYDKYWDTVRWFWEEHREYWTPEPKAYLRDLAKLPYNIDSQWQLQQALDAAIEPLKPEQKRKKKLYQAVMNCVAAEGSIQRSVLLKKEFPDATAEEVRYCYRDLIRKYKLVEYKMGNRWFVTLADKEKERREKAAARKMAQKAEEPKGTES